jgi:hypothetical protein
MQESIKSEFLKSIAEVNAFNGRFKPRGLKLIKFLYWLVLLELVFFLHWINLYDSDEGIVLTIAREILNGHKLYFDIFEFVAPGSFYFLAGIFKIFGVHFYLAKLLSIMAIFFSAGGIYKISNLIFKNKLSYLAPFIFVFMTANWPAISYNTFNLFFTIWAIYFFIAFLPDHNKKYIIASGLLACLAILFHQTKGMIVLLAISSFLLFSAIKEKNIYWLKIIAYYNILSLIPLSLLFLVWPPKLLFNNLFIFPFFNYSETVKAPYNLLVYFLFFLFLSAWALRSEKRPVWFLLYLQLALLLSTVSLANSYHVNLVLFPIIILLPLIFYKIAAQKIFLKTVFIIFSITALYMMFRLQIAFTYNVLIKNRTYNIVPLKKYVEENCLDSKYIYAGPFLPQLYFEFRKLSPTPYVWLITNHHTPAQFLDAKNYLEKNQPACAILNYNMVKKYKYDINNPVDDYINKNYQPAYADGNILIFKKISHN